MKHIYKLPVYVGIILKDNNRVLLVQRHNTDWMPNFLNFPDGLLEENETLITAAKREEPHRHAAVNWFNLEKLPTDIAEHALLAIESIIKITDIMNMDGSNRFF